MKTKIPVLVHLYLVPPQLCVVSMCASVHVMHVCVHVHAYACAHVYVYNGPYSLLVCGSCFISCSIYAQSTSVIFIVCKWRWGCRYFLTSRISVPCSEAIRLIIR